MDKNSGGSAIFKQTCIAFVLHFFSGMDAQLLHIDFTVPQGWHELDEKHLRFVYHLIATDHTADEMKSLALLHWSDAKVVDKQHNGAFLLQEGK